MPEFTHLHVHTQYSLLDGAARLKDLFAACGELGMTHLAISDHGNLHGAYDFFHQAQKAGITPIIGIEAYVAPDSRRTKQRVLWGQPHQKRDDVAGSGSYTHKTIWARNATGLHNLFRLSSDAYQEGWLQKWPRMDKDSLAQWSEGLIASTGCPSGEVQTRLRLGQYDEALEAAASYQDIFGRDSYFLELMDHGIESDGSATACSISAAPLASRRSSRTTPTTPMPVRRARTMRCCASRPGRTSPTRTASASTAPATT